MTFWYFNYYCISKNMECFCYIFCSYLEGTESLWSSLSPTPIPLDEEHTWYILYPSIFFLWSLPFLLCSLFIEYSQRIRLLFWDWLPPLPPHACMPYLFALWLLSSATSETPVSLVMSDHLPPNQIQVQMWWLLMTAEDRHERKELGLRLDPLSHSKEKLSLL